MEDHISVSVLLWCWIAERTEAAGCGHRRSLGHKTWTQTWTQTQQTTNSNEDITCLSYSKCHLMGAN